MAVYLANEAFEPWSRLAAYVPDCVSGEAGANAVFVGLLRDHHLGDAVTHMHIEHYPGMTERELDNIVAEAMHEWPLFDALIIHRVGAIPVGDAIVLVAVWSAHRGAAFDGCAYVMEQLKSRAPFWKKETLAAGERWVERNTAR
jgi:molybdopterin synthase catalytic subunit